MSQERPQEPVHLGRVLLALGIGLLCWWLGGLLPFGPDARPDQGRLALFVTGLTTSCWLLSAMPLAAASLLPLVLLPLLGVRATKDLTSAYADPVLWLFAGGFVLAQAIERWSLHRRLSLWVLRLVGPYPRRLVLGMMLAATLLSLFINNTSTALMLLPIGWALVQRATASGAMPPAEGRAFGTALMLAIAYGASFGGMGTPIGTAPNALFLANHRPLVEQGDEPVSFLHWVLAFGPFALLMAFCGSWVLNRIAFRVPARRLPDADLLQAEARALGPMSQAERRTALLFAVAVVLWMTRADVRLGDAFTIPGWASLLLGSAAGHVADATVSIGVAVAAFLVSAGTGDGRRLMDWPTARTIPFDILLLLGGGIAIADAFEPTGLSGAFGNLLAPLVGELHPLLLILIMVTVILILSEIASNTAIAALFLPLMVASAQQAGIDPLALMLPTTLAASCGFMLPIATPPNALVFATGHVGFREMALAGFWIDLCAIVLLTLVLWFWALPLLGVSFAPQPR